MIDQNFVEEDSGVQMVNTACSKKRKTIYAVHKSGNDQVLSKSTLKKEYNFNHGVKMGTFFFGQVHSLSDFSVYR